MDRLPARARAVERWANGRGRTATVARAAGWRVSVATIDDASPFSAFPGLSRILMPLSPAGLELTVDGGRRILRPLQATAFAGEDAVRAGELRAPAEVLNLMWERDRHRGTLTALPVVGAAELAVDAGVLVAIVAGGRLALAGGESLGRLDAVSLQPGQAATVSGDGHLVLARIV